MKKSKNKNIILTAGGTGGHIYPAEALAVELQKRGYNVTFYTDSRGLGNYNGILSELPSKTILSGSVVGKSTFTKIISLFKVLLGCIQAFILLLFNRPRAVVGFGGYASFPTALAAVVLRIPLVIHEQNSVMSRTNRILARFATRTAQSFRNVKNTPAQAKEFLSGMPVRDSIVKLYSNQYQMWDKQRPFTIIILGGSQGAKIFSEIIPQAITLLSTSLQEKLVIYQQCRKDDEENIRNAYKKLFCRTTISSFFANMPELYAQADLMISRSGASSVYEIAAAGIPSILVPLPTAADNHQYYNAKELNDCGGAILIEQKDFTSQSLNTIITDLLKTPTKLRKLASHAKECSIVDAQKRLADEIEKL